MESRQLEPTVELYLGPGTSRGGGGTPGGQHRLFLLAETCAGSLGLSHCLHLCSPGTGCAQRWVDVGCLLPHLGHLQMVSEENLISSALYSSRNEASEIGSILDINNKFIIYLYDPWTLQIPKGNTLFEIRKHFQPKDQSDFSPVKMEFDYFCY